jgi:hypothetical protein
VGLKIGLVVARGFGMDETENCGASKLDMVQPLSARVVCSRFARTKYCAFRSSHVKGTSPIDGARVTVGVKAAKASAGDLDLGKVIVSDVSRGPSDHVRKADTDPDARQTERVLGRCRFGGGAALGIEAQGRSEQKNPDQMLTKDHPPH